MHIYTKPAEATRLLVSIQHSSYQAPVLRKVLLEKPRLFTNTAPIFVDHIFRATSNLTALVKVPWPKHWSSKIQTGKADVRRKQILCQQSWQRKVWLQASCFQLWDLEVMSPLLLPGSPGYSTVYLRTLFQTLSVLKLKSVSCDASIHSSLQPSPTKPWCDSTEDKRAPSLSWLPSATAMFPCYL